MNTAEQILQKHIKITSPQHWAYYHDVLAAMKEYASQSVATPEAEIEKMADKYAGDTIFDFKGEIMVSHDDVTCETKKAFIAGYKAAIKKDEPDLVASDREKLINFLMTIDECYGMHVREDAERCVDNYLASVPSNDEASLASHTCTSSNSIKQWEKDLYDKWTDWFIGRSHVDEVIRWIKEKVEEPYLNVLEDRLTDFESETGNRIRASDAYFYIANMLKIEKGKSVIEAVQSLLNTNHQQ